MKKIVATLVSSLLVLGGASTISSCGGGEKKLPTSSYEKVQFAFDGVESSLKNNGGKRAIAKVKDNPNAFLEKKKISNDSLSTIYGAMFVEEETSNPNFEYDEPPMIQFQYLKALYEEMGDQCEFGKKYSHTLNGSIYYDFKNRTAPNEDRFLNRYSFTCSFSLNIDDNDLISANVGFDLTFDNNGVLHHQKMYVSLLLDYDMNEASPTYELTMNAVTDLLDYEEEDEKYFDDEYDYVKV